MTDDDRALLQLLHDRSEIENAAVRLGRGLDARDGSSGELFASCMTPDVVVEYPFGSWQGLEAQKKSQETSLAALFPLTRHHLTNALIDVQGDRATAQYYVAGVHSTSSPDGEQIVWGGCLYDHELVRTPDGWRISRHVCHDTWIADDGSLMDSVAASASA